MIIRILVKELSGFRKNHSCESALNFVINEWKLKIDDNDTIFTDFLDLKRTFETVDSLKNFTITALEIVFFNGSRVFLLTGCK